MSLHRRLKKLESSAPPEKPCLECGFAPGAPEEFEVSWADETDEPPVPEFCPGCGGQTVYVVTWGEG